MGTSWGPWLLEQVVVCSMLADIKATSSAILDLIKGSVSFVSLYNLGSKSVPVFSQCYAVCSVLFDNRVETEISVCLETKKLLSQGPLIGQHSQLSSLHIRVTQGQGVDALVNAVFTLPVWVHS